MGEIIYREDRYAYELSNAGNDLRVKILLGPFTTEITVPEGKCHHILGLSYEALAEQFQQDGKGPHVHTVKTPVGPEGAIFQPDPDKPSR